MFSLLTLAGGPAIAGSSDTPQHCHLGEVTVQRCGPLVDEFTEGVSGMPCCWVTHQGALLHSSNGAMGKHPSRLVFYYHV